MSRDTALFRIYTGPQSGAQFDLTEGQYVLGKGNDADLIFTDTSLEDKHCVLNVSAEGIVFVEPIDGTCYFNDVEFKENTRFESTQLLRIGTTVIACIDALSEEIWPSYEELLKNKLKEDLEKNVSEKTEELEQEENKSVDEKALENTQNKEDIKSKFHFIKWALLALLLIALLLSLIFGSSLFGSDPQDLEFKRMQAFIKEQGLNDVELLKTDGAFVIKGNVDSHKSFYSLVENLPKISFNIVLDLKVRDEPILGLERMLKIMGFDAKAQYGKDGIVVNAYMQDPYVEAQVFTKLKDLYKDNLTGHIVYKDELQKALLSQINKSHINNLKLIFTEGKIYYQGKLTLDELNKLHTISKYVGDKYGIPLILRDQKEIYNLKVETISDLFESGDLITQKENLEDKNISYQEVNKPLSPKAFEPLNIEDVMGVSLDPMRFITLRNGHKYFEGGVLPSGYTVSKIDLNKIVVTKGGESHEYQLR